MKFVHSATAALAAGLALAGCLGTEPARNVRPSGFLGDYSTLGRGGEGEPALLYWNPKADFRAYSKVIVERATIWRVPGSSLDDVPKAELEHLAILLTARIIEAVKREGLTIVHEPGPGVMRIRSAITEAEQSALVLDLVTSAVPLPSLTKVATGTRAFVGKASVEGEIRDAMTDERLAAMVDRRAGNRLPSGVQASWSDVEMAFQYWSDRLAYRLCRERGATHCVRP
jgi:hypothetical protein